jgi:formylmethanofuran dehydrogenase subunit E
MLSNDLLESAVMFHSHFGPFIRLGLKADIIGTAYLGKDNSELSAKVETACHPPR